MYLKDRRSIVLNHNPFMMLRDDPRPEYNDQVQQVHSYNSTSSSPAPAACTDCSVNAGVFRKSVKQHELSLIQLEV